MDYRKVLRQAWKEVWRYRALWVFGVVLALTTTSWSAATLYNWRDNRVEEWGRQGITVTVLGGETFWEAFQRTMQAKIDRANRELDRLLVEELHIHIKSNVIVITAVLLGMVLIVALVSRAARYVGEVALIRMVSEAEATGERYSVWRGLCLGWSRSAWRIVLIDVLLGVLAVLASLMLFGLILGPLPLWVNGSEFVIFVLALSTAGLFLLAIVVMIAFGAALGVVKRLAWRAAAVEGVGVLVSIQHGWTVVRQRLKDVGLIWLITLAVRLAWQFAMLPAVLLLMGVGVLVGGLSAVLAGGITSLGTTGDVPAFIALAVGISIFLFLMVAPLILLAGLREVFLSSVWTLTYRELRPAGATRLKRAGPIPPLHA